jgi:hypothetical protein
LIDEVRWMRTAGGQITAVDNKVRRNLPQVGENRLERAAIAMNIRYYGDSHLVSNSVAFRIRKPAPAILT